MDAVRKSAEVPRNEWLWTILAAAIGGVVIGVVPESWWQELWNATESLLGSLANILNS